MNLAIIGGCELRGLPPHPREALGQGHLSYRLTVRGQEDDRGRTEEAGFNGHVVKPRKLARLDETIRSIAGDDKVTPLVAAAIHFKILHDFAPRGP